MVTKKRVSVKDLSPEAQKVIQDKFVSASKRLSKWIALLKELSDFDGRVDEAYKRERGRALWATAVSFPLVILSLTIVVISEGHPFALIFAGMLIITVTYTLVYFWSKTSELAKVNLDNMFRETLLPVFYLLSEDVDPKAKIKVELNFDDPASDYYMESSEEIPPGRFIKLVETVFFLHCCHARMPLINDTVLVLDITKSPASYKRNYRSASGKYKSKTKWKMLTTVTASVVPAKTSLQIDAPALKQLAGSEKVSVSEKKSGRQCKLTRRIKSKSVSGAPTITIQPELIIEMFMKLCNTLSRAA